MLTFTYLPPPNFDLKTNIENWPDLASKTIEFLFTRVYNLRVGKKKPKENQMKNEPKPQPIKTLEEKLLEQIMEMYK